jgi:hypothetical protein
VDIPGRGDLAPRRRQRRPGRLLALVVVVAVLAGIGYGGYVLFHGGSSSKHDVALSTCPPTTVPGPDRPGRVHVVVLNGTLTSGLAAKVANGLKHRGFHIASVGNTDKLIKSGTAIVFYRPGWLYAAQAVADQIAGAQLVRGSVVNGSVVKGGVVKSSAPGVQLAVGPSFTTLASRSAAAASRRHFGTVDADAAGRSPSPTPAPTCTPVP